MLNSGLWRWQNCFFVITLMVEGWQEKVWEIAAKSRKDLCWKENPGVNVG
jgi:hypothetical protein